MPFWRERGERREKPERQRERKREGERGERREKPMRKREREERESPKNEREKERELKMGYLSNILLSL